MNEDVRLNHRQSWQKRYNGRRLLVLCLEIAASSGWLLYGAFPLVRVDVALFAAYLVMFVLLFLPGLLYVIYDIVMSKEKTPLDCFDAVAYEPEDAEFTRLILKGCVFMLVFLAIVVIPAFFLLDLLQAFLWTLFMTSIVTLVVATLMGAQWKLNTSGIF
jgi:hypothetical protein